MSKYRDLVGKRFGQLTVIKRSQKRDAVNSSYKWVCLCDCGNYILCRTDNLNSGHTKRCSICNNNRGLRSVFVGGDGVDDQI